MVTAISLRRQFLEVRELVLKLVNQTVLAHRDAQTETRLDFLHNDVLRTEYSYVLTRDEHSGKIEITVDSVNLKLNRQLTSEFLSDLKRALQDEIAMVHFVESRPYYYEIQGKPIPYIEREKLGMSMSERGMHWIRFTEDRSGNLVDTPYRVWVDGIEGTLATFASIDRAITYMYVLEEEGYSRDHKLDEKFDEWESTQVEQFHD